MATSTTLVSKNDADRNVFQDDDEETWRLIVAPQSRVEACGRLTSVGDRLEEDLDSKSEESFWNDVCKELQRKGFRISGSSSPPAKVGSSDSTAFPEAFKSDDGKRHLAAVTAMLQITERRAMEVTMSALRSIDTEGVRLQNLMGTQDCVLKTLRYHHQQRLARLGVLTEALRLEQDAGAVDPNKAAFLDRMDGAFTVNGAKRGIFRRLVYVSCRPHLPPSRTQLEPSKKLDFSVASESKFSRDKRWNRFVSECMDIMQSAEIKERCEAMEALLAYLYERVEGGVSRTDYAILLVAFSSCHQFFTELQGGQRLSQLSGLICAESMCLWRALDNDTDWIQSHPLLTGVISGEAESEIEALQSLALECGSQLVARVTAKQQGTNSASSSSVEVEAPESIALVSLGLLLYLAYNTLLSSSEYGGDSDAYWQTFQGSGLEMVQTANEKCGAFEYLHSVVESLAATDTADSLVSMGRPTVYDWQFAQQQEGGRLLLTDGSGGDSSDGTVVAYMSIAREILTSSIAAFQDSLLSIDHVAACENLGVLCSLASAIYRNDPVLCSDFWDDWNAVTATDNESELLSPMSQLMNSAHSLAVSAQFTAASSTEAGIGELYVSAVAPLIQLLSATCYDPISAEKAIKLLPPGLIGQTISFCKPSSVAYQTQALIKHRNTILKSLTSLVRIAKTESCQAVLRDSFEVEGADGSATVTAQLARLLGGTIDVAAAESVLLLLAYFVQRSSPAALVQLLRLLNDSQMQDARLSHLLGQYSGATLAGCQILREFIRKMSAVAFSDALSHEDIAVYLRELTACVQASGVVLASSPSTASSFLTSNSNISDETVFAILDCHSALLDDICIIINVHESVDMRNKASEIRSALVVAFSSSAGLGQAIAHYATSPVSMSLMAKLQVYLDDADILDAPSKDEAMDLGAWTAVVSKSASEVKGKISPPEQLSRWLDSFERKDIDLEAIQVRRPPSKGTLYSPVQTALAALRLLHQWAAHTREIVEDLKYTAGSDQQMDVDAFSYAGFGPDTALANPATVPAGFVVGSAAVTTWKSVGISNLDLILRYFPSTSSTHEQIGNLAIPALVLFRTLLACSRDNAQRANVEGDTLIRSMQSSSFFFRDFVGQIEANLEQDHAENKKLIETILGLELIAACSKRSAVFGRKLVEADAFSLRLLSKQASLALEIMQLSKGSHSDEIFERPQILSKLRLASAAMNVLGELWTAAFRSLLNKDNVSSSLVQSIKNEPGVLKDLSSLIAEHSSIVQNANNGDGDTILHRQQAQIVMVNIIGTAMRIVTTEMAWKTQLEPSTTGLLDKIVSPIQDELPYIVQHCSTFGCIELAGNAAKDFYASAKKFDQLRGVSSPRQLLDSFPSIPAIQYAEDGYARENRFNPNALMLWLASLSSKTSILTPEDRMSDWNDLPHSLCISHQLMDSQLHLQHSLQSLVEMLLLLDESRETSDGTMPRQGLLSALEAALRALQSNTVCIDGFQVEVSQTFLQQEGYSMALSLAETIVSMAHALSSSTSSGPSKSATGDLLKLVSILSNTSKRLFDTIAPKNETRLSEEYAEKCSMLQQPILIAAIILLREIESQNDILSSAYSEQRDNAYIDLAVVATQTLGTLQSWEVSPDSATRTLLQRTVLMCTSTLSILVGRRESSSSRDLPRRFMSRVAETLRDGRAIGLLLAKVNSESGMTSSFPPKGLAKTSPQQESKNVALVQAIFTLLYAIAVTGDANMLSLLANTTAIQVIAHNPILVQVSALWNGQESSLAFRGYMDVGADFMLPATSAAMSEADPRHELWLTALKIVSCSLQVVHRQSAGSIPRTVSEFVYKLATAFIGCYKPILLGCLQTICSKTVPLTVNALQETRQILALISSMCDRRWNILMFPKQDELLQDFIILSTQTVVHLSTFLGASGTSRELFKALADFDSSNTDGYGVAMSINSLLIDGLPNAKHEAIRYSHFASKCFARITKDDLGASDIVPAKFKHLSLHRPEDSSLERNCRRSVTSSFVLQIEHYVAECLSEAIGLLSRAHPAAASFVNFTVHEARQLHSMAFIKQGAIISYRTMSSGGQFSASADDKLGFGRVLEVDTVNQAWKVQVIERSSPLLSALTDKMSTVPMHCLAGCEDVAKRNYIVGYRPAPDNATDLEKSSSALSLGHLILVLKWCYQNYDKNDKNSKILQRLAEETTRLLGTDLTIHHELGSPLSVPKSSRAILGAQLLELFEVADPKNPTTMGVQEGKLKDILCHEVWTSVQAQIAQETHFAQQQRIQLESRQSGRPDAGSMGNQWFGGRRLSGNKSPFRSMS